MSRIAAITAGAVGATALAAGLALAALTGAVGVPGDGDPASITTPVVAPPSSASAPAPVTGAAVGDRAADDDHGEARDDDRDDHEDDDRDDEGEEHDDD